MADADDLISGLNKYVETQSLGDRTEGESTADLVSRIGRQMGEVSIAVDSEGVNERTFQSVLKNSGVQMPNRKTPYEVWAEKQKGPTKKTPPKLKKKDINSLVSKLHSSNKKKEQTLMAQSNANLAEELQHLRFQPELNKKSQEQAKGVNPLLERQAGMMEKKDKELKALRATAAKLEMAECTFSPKLLGSQRGEKYLKKAGKDGPRSTDDILQWEKDKETRRLQRKQIVEEMEEAELSFTPHLNRRSLMLTDKLKKEGKYDIDPVTKQTINSPRKFASKMNASFEEKRLAGHEEETFKPKINERSVSSDGRSVHRRLYEDAVKSHVTKHNKQLEYKERSLKGVPSKAWETEKMVHGGPSPWVLKMRAQENKGNRSFSQDTFIDDSGEPPINVLEYHPKYNFILEKIRFGGGDM